ncbi:MAG TPA: AraC family transcriptional regulator [Chitinophagaceae bacterium]|jgi:AraC-like DNA-binding protein|nr:AraC family transcriptional regulator [Chitinophagaceae bacterium]
MVDCNLTSFTHGAIDLAPQVPKAFSGLLMQNSKVNYAEGNYGNLMMQEIELNEYTLHYNIYHIQNRFLLNVKRDLPTLMIHVALKNEIQYHTDSIGDVLLKEGQFNIVYFPFIDGTLTFEQAGEYRIFKIFLPAEVLQNYATTFPYLNEFLEHITESLPAMLLKEHGWINTEISYIINQIIQCTYDEAVRKLYFDNLVKELLLLLLLQKQKNYLNGQRYMQSLYEARSIIQKNVAQHFTITEIAKQVGLNETKLRNGFKQIFGTGIFQFMLQAKMQKAWTLVLETNMPVKNIASETGYTSKQNFLTAFKKYFNATPGSLRKKS